MLMSMTTLPISGISFPSLRSELGSPCLNGETHSSIACSRRANAFGKPARCSSRSSTLGNPLWLRQQPGEAALDGAERAMEQDQRPAGPVDLVVHPQAVDLGVAARAVVAHYPIISLPAGNRVRRPPCRTSSSPPVPGLSRPPRLRRGVCPFRG